MEIARDTQKDFDRIALLAESHGSFAAAEMYHHFLADLVPLGTGSVLEVGSGSGSFSKMIAERTIRLTGIDLSPEMVRIASSLNLANASFICGDFLTTELSESSYDVVVSVATLHHLPLEAAVRRMKAVLRPGGLLVIHDLAADSGVADTLRSVAALPVSFGYRLWKTGKLRMPADLRKAWEEHGRGETYMTAADLEHVRQEYLPGAQITRHLLWRYTLLWNKPDDRA